VLLLPNTLFSVAALIVFVSLAGWEWARLVGFQEFKQGVFVAVLLFAGLIGFFVYRVSGVAEVAERMSVETRIRQLQAAIDMEFANLMMLDQQKKAINWLGKNPFPLLKAATESENIFSDYLGEHWNRKYIRAIQFTFQQTLPFCWNTIPT